MHVVQIGETPDFVSRTWTPDECTNRMANVAWP
jgi:hypothetical protein